MRHATTERQRRHRLATSQAMRRHAQARTCPACRRGAALAAIRARGLDASDTALIERLVAEEMRRG